MSVWGCYTIVKDLKQSYFLFKGFECDLSIQLSISSTYSSGSALILPIHVFSFIWPRKSDRFSFVKSPPYFIFYFICPLTIQIRKYLYLFNSILNWWLFFTAKGKLERLQFSTSSSFVKIWSACSCEFKVYFWTFWALYHLLFDLETIGIN